MFFFLKYVFKIYYYLKKCHFFFLNNTVKSRSTITGERKTIYVHSQRYSSIASPSNPPTRKRRRKLTPPLFHPNNGGSRGEIRAIIDSIRPHHRIHRSGSQMEKEVG